jgi:sialate O-acetylesterase
MVLQRNHAIPVYGKADAGQRIEVSFNKRSLSTSADAYGNWKVIFPAMEAGGPYQLKIRTNKTNIVFKDIVMGDVWLCSGQSNMAFRLDQSAGASTELKRAANTNLRLFKLNGLSETNNTPWDSVTLAKTNKLEFFSGAWQTSDSLSAAGFSAIAYHFGKEIQAEENIPIGLIEIAVGGSPIESWIDRKTLEHDEQLVDLLTGWRKSDFIMPWVRERANLNLKNSVSVNQRHPYEPAYNYEAGIANLVQSPIKGVIWYQGESNTHNAELYQTEFKTLVQSWRQQWIQNLPFYYVQLSSIARPSWPYFRNMQRELQSQISGIGMAVSSDLGDSLDVHPVRKKEIGHRLALLALKSIYDKPVSASGPIAFEAVKKGDDVLVSFTETKQLSTKNNEMLTGFELLTEKGRRLSVPASINKNQVHLKIPEGEKVKSVLYAWEPFTRANLINETGLPASTFTISIK